MITRCRSCGAEIVMALTAAGKHMPIDAQPSDVPTNLQAYRAGQDNELHCRPIDLSHPFDERVSRYAVSHFATCPNADAHRRRK